MLDFFDEGLRYNLASCKLHSISLKMTELAVTKLL